MPTPHARVNQSHVRIAGEICKFVLASFCRLGKLQPTTNEGDKQMMIGYVTIGALDEAKAQKFYDALFGEMGCDRKFTDGGWTGYGARGQDNHDVYIVAKTANGEPAKAGNGIMISFKAKTNAEVDGAYKAGLSHGGADEGAPGPRPADSKAFYGAYLRDPTGNKICVYHKP